FRERDRAALVARLASKAEPPRNMAAILRHNLGEADATTIAPADLQALREEQRDTVLLDVRSRLEFEGSWDEGATHLPLQVVSARLDEIPEQREVGGVCRTGGRATIAAEALA